MDATTRRQPAHPAHAADPADPAPVPRPLPARTGLAGEFYGWLSRGELRFQRCGSCRRWRHLPRPICPACHSREWSWERSHGTGRIHSWTVTHRPLHPAFTDVPYAQVLVEMDEGPRVLSWVVDATPDELAFDMRVSLRLVEVDGTTLPAFGRADGS
jgi:uncharacterized OB-fold protein